MPDDSVEILLYKLIFLITAVLGIGVLVPLIIIIIPILMYGVLAMAAIYVTLYSSHGKQISKPPGSTLLTIVDFLYAPKAVEDIFEPIVADWRTEYFDALKQGRTIKAHWISVRYIYSFIIAMGLNKIFSFVKNFTSVNK